MRGRLGLLAIAVVLNGAVSAEDLEEPTRVVLRSLVAEAENRPWLLVQVPAQGGRQEPGTTPLPEQDQIEPEEDDPGSAVPS